MSRDLPKHLSDISTTVVGLVLDHPNLPVDAREKLGQVSVDLMALSQTLRRISTEKVINPQ